MRAADVALVNSSLNNLGDALLHNRMMAQQQGNTEAALGERQREFDVTANEASQRTAATQQHYNAEQAHWDEIEKTAKLQQNLKQLGEYGQQMKDSFVALGDQVRGGALTSDEANQYVLDSINQMPDEMKQQFLNNPQFKAITDNKVDWSKVGAAKPPANHPPADVEKDLAAAQLETEAASETDPVMKQLKQERAKALRSGIGRPAKEPARPFSQTTKDPNNPNVSMTEHMTADEWSAKKESQIPAAPKDPKERKVGTTYKLPSGKFIWRGTGWEAVK